MRDTTLCNMVNLSIVAVLWAAIVAIPNWLHGRLLPFWVNIPLAIFGMIASGYIVQYLISRHVNNWIMGAVEESDADAPKRER